MLAEVEVRIKRKWAAIGRQISETDRPLDRLVYELYGLSEEIKIVEEATVR